MAQVDEWKKRRDEIEAELAQVWVEGRTEGADGESEGKRGEGKSEILEEPAYVHADGARSEETTKTTSMDESEVVVEKAAELGQEQEQKQQEKEQNQPRQDGEDIVQQ